MTSPLYQLSVQKYLPHFPDTKEFYVWRHQFEFKGWCHLMRPNRLECCFFIIKAKKSDSEWREWKSAFLHYFQKTNNGKYFFYDETIGTRTIQHFIIEWLVEYSKIMTHSWSHHGKSCSFAMAGTIEAFLSTLPGVYMSVCWYHHNSARCSHERFAVQIKLKYGFDHHISTADTVCVMVLGIW